MQPEHGPSHSTTLPLLVPLVEAEPARETAGRLLEIYDRILSYLHPETLMDARCVCKAWYASGTAYLRLRRVNLQRRRLVNIFAYLQQFSALSSTSAPPCFSTTYSDTTITLMNDPSKEQRRRWRLAFVDSTYISHLRFSYSYVAQLLDGEVDLLLDLTPHLVSINLSHQQLSLAAMVRLLQRTSSTLEELILNDRTQPGRSLLPADTIEQLSLNSGPHFRRLDIRFKFLLPDYVVLLKNCPKLDSLSIGYSGVTPSICLPALSAYGTQLRRLQFYGAHFDSEGIASLARACPNLTNFGLEQNIPHPPQDGRGKDHRLDDYGEDGYIGAEGKGMRVLTECCPGLEKVHFSGTNFGQQGYSLFFNRPGRGCLRWVNLSGCYIRDHGLEALVLSNPGLERLRLNECGLLTDKGLCAVLQHCHELRMLDAGLISRLTDAIFDLPLWACQKLECLTLSRLEDHDTHNLPLSTLQEIKEERKESSKKLSTSQPYECVQWSNSSTSLLSTASSFGSGDSDLSTAPSEYSHSSFQVNQSVPQEMTIDLGRESQGELMGQQSGRQKLVDQVQRLVHLRELCLDDMNLEFTESDFWKMGAAEEMQGDLDKPKIRPKGGLCNLELLSMQGLISKVSKETMETILVAFPKLRRLCMSYNQPIVDSQDTEPWLQSIRPGFVLSPFVGSSEWWCDW